MLLLASILGEVKPPVASKEDIEAAGGITKVGLDANIVEGDRCLVCLGDYEDEEDCRTLSSCGHLFHKDCIDQVQTGLGNGADVVSGSLQDGIHVRCVVVSVSLQKMESPIQRERRPQHPHKPNSASRSPDEQKSQTRWNENTATYTFSFSICFAIRGQSSIGFCIFERTFCTLWGLLVARI
jgi:hypothetical protein